jgi:hypothetical protein
MRTSRVADTSPISAAAVSVAEGEVCIIRPDGTLACWGADVAPSAGQFTQVVVGGDYAGSCGLTRAGRIRCWGVDPDAAYGAEDPDFAALLASRGPPGGRFLDISLAPAGGWNAGCAVRIDGRILCWGVGGMKSPSGTFVDVTLYSDASAACGLHGRPHLLLGGV